jgi:hypothetical protein
MLAKDPQRVKAHNARLSLICPSVPKEAIPPTNLPRLGILGISMSRQIFQNESGLSVRSGYGNKQETMVSIKTKAGTMSYGGWQESSFGVLMTLSSPQQLFIISFVPVASPELLCALHVSNKSSRLSRGILVANSLNSKFLLDTTSAG